MAPCARQQCEPASFSEDFHSCLVIELASYRRKKRRAAKAPSQSSRSKASRKPDKLPYIVTLMKKALEFQRLLDSGEVKNRAELAQRDGVTRARVTQLMKLLLLAPEIRAAILALPLGTPLQLITERKLRPLVVMESHAEQIEAFKEIAGNVVSRDVRERKAG